MNAADYVNQVLFRGGIVHKFRADKWLVLTLATSLNQSNKDYPKVYWYDELIDKIDQSYDVGDRVKLPDVSEPAKRIRNNPLWGRQLSSCPDGSTPSLMLMNTCPIKTRFC